MLFSFQFYGKIAVSKCKQKMNTKFNKLIKMVIQCSMHYALLPSSKFYSIHNLTLNSLVCSHHKRGWLIPGDLNPRCNKWCRHHNSLLLPIQMQIKMNSNLSRAFLISASSESRASYPPRVYNTCLKRELFPGPVYFNSSNFHSPLVKKHFSKWVCGLWMLQKQVSRVSKSIS